MDAIETIEREGFTIGLHYEEGPQNPRADYDHLGILAQLSTRFTQPDKSDWRADALINAWERFDRDIAKVERYARAYLGAAVIDWWEDPTSASRVVGIITREDVAKEGLPDPAAYLKGELDEYAAWADGEVYYWTVDGPDGQSESCGGYYGDTAYALGEAQSTVDAMIADRHATRWNMYRRLVNAAS